MGDAIGDFDEYRMPSKEILRNRQELYGLWRRSDDGTATWLKRIQNCIGRCEYPRILMEFFLFDRFVCGLDANELECIQDVKSWSLKQMPEDFLNIFGIDDPTMVGENISQNESVPLDIVKAEPVCSYFDTIYPFMSPIRN